MVQCYNYDEWFVYQEIFWFIGNQCGVVNYLVSNFFGWIFFDNPIFVALFTTKTYA